VITGEVIVEMPVEQARSMAVGPEVQAAAEAQVHRRCSADRSTERIGGYVAILHDTECDGKHFTGARWAAFQTYLQGEAEGPGSASLQLMIYRTVRFDRESGR
jgi:hypothetical protein